MGDVGMLGMTAAGAGPGVGAVAVAVRRAAAAPGPAAPERGRPRAVGARRAVALTRRDHRAVEDVDVVGAPPVVGRVAALSTVEGAVRHRPQPAAGESRSGR